ncbi:MAG: DNA replication and repair protein RecF [Halofilum sp. (in: g-proteobacteria)]|nr:DNA replication and repair protein RecF [Halofilum sp. (in: g-proteobacteria)]
MRLDGRSLERVTDLARALPVVVVHPGSHELVGGGPGERRRLLDFGLFHVEPGFHAVWQRYRRAVGQRNALLRGRRGERELLPWEQEIATAGARLDELRRAYVADLAPRVGRLGEEVLGATVTLDYRAGWTGTAALGDALDAARARDRELLATSVGPHRADVALRLEGREVRQRVSRGQQKMLVYVLRLAQAEQLGEGGGCALLLDDLPAELDRERRARVLALAARVGAQVFVTALEPGSLDLPPGVAAKVFHVEQGEVSEVIQ